MLHECLHDVEVEVRGPGIRDVTPAQFGNVYVGQQLVVFGRYRGEGEAKVTLKAKVSGEPRTWSCTADLPDVDRDNPELERLWAMSAIDDQMERIREKGETEDSRSAVANLGIEYSLVTDYTSMIVVNESVFEEEGIAQTNADRVQRERAAQDVRHTASPRSCRVDNQGGNSGGAFDGRSAPGLGTGPVGPLFIGLLAWLARARSKSA